MGHSADDEKINYGTDAIERSGENEIGKKLADDSRQKILSPCTHALFCSCAAEPEELGNETSHHAAISCYRRASDETGDSFRLRTEEKRYLLDDEGLSSVALLVFPPLLLLLHLATSGLH